MSHTSSMPSPAELQITQPKTSREGVKRDSAAAGAQGNVQMVPTIIKRGVRSLENNQAVIDREAWFKARPLLSGLTSYLLVMGWEHVPVRMLAPAAPTCGGHVGIASLCPGSVLPQPTAAGRVLAPYAQAQGGNARKTHIGV